MTMRLPATSKRTRGAASAEYLTRPLRIAPIPSPREVRLLKNGWLEAAIDAVMEPKSADPGLLFDFCMLGGAEADEIREFASRHGMLGGITWRLFFLDEDEVVPSARRRREPIHMWRELADGFRALLRIAADQRQRGRGDAADWRLAATALRETPPGDLSPRDQREMLERLVRGWLDLGHVRPAPVLSSMDATLQLEGTGLVSVLAAQLLFAISTKHGVGVCADPDCGRPFLRRSVAIAGRRTFCEDCGLAAAQRAASRDYYERNGERIAERRRAAKGASDG
jgi:hypothetical protein